MTKTNHTELQGSLPLLLRPDDLDTDLIGWARTNLDFINSTLHGLGGILFRGFESESIAMFDQFVRSVAPDLLDYKERSTPRTQVAGNIYTSTEYPADQHIALHNEFSYSETWPMKIAFCCAQPADTGGETPIADSRKVFNLIDPEIRNLFIEKKVSYVRNYGSGIDLSWPDAFQTKDKSVVEDYCRNANIEFEWLTGNKLKTRQIRQAVTRHPITGEDVWFNQTHLFHTTNLAPGVRQALLSIFKEDDLPRNAYFGDGSRIENSMLDAVRNAYDQATVLFPWQTGDILLLDNVLVAHGRTPYTGSRKIHVAMGEPYSSNK